VTVRDDEAATLWSKLAVLAPIALVTTWTAAPMGRPGPGTGTSWWRWSARSSAARADGVELDEAATVAILERVPDAMRSSMQKDAAAGRPIELDAIGGAILRAADAPAPRPRSPPAWSPTSANATGSRPAQLPVGTCRSSADGRLGGSLPLDRARGLGGDVVGDPVDAGDLADDPGRDALQHLPGEAGEVGVMASWLVTARSTIG
jgi:hypothetical protein